MKARNPLRSPWLLFISFLGMWSLWSLTYFIYTAPGEANSYLYRFHLLRYSMADSFKKVGRHALSRMIRTSMIDYEYNDDYMTTMVPSNITFLPENFTYNESEVCPEKFKDMTGPFYVNMTEIAMDDIYQTYGKLMEMGGHWQPHDCKPKWKVAFLIPFRNRHQHLPILLRHLLPMLIKQHLFFTIFLIEQTGDYPFNRAMLFNVGYTEILKRGEFDCMVFHDVDHVPENDRTYYGCTDFPRHFSTQLDIHNYHLEYDSFFGGVTGVTMEQFKKVNGYTNQFWGWGGEDDDFYTRMTQNNYTVSRPPDAYGRYQSIRKNHHQEAMFLGRFSLLKKSKERNFLDGLNTLHYKTPIITEMRFYTNITVNLHPIEDLPYPTYS